MTENILLSVLIAFGVTFYAIPKIIIISEQKMLFDVPDHRKLHKLPIPSLGGVGIFAGLVIAFLIMQEFTKSNNLQYFVLSFFVVFFFGIKDDLIGLPPQKKLFGQLLVALILTWKTNILLTHMHGFLGLQAVEGNLRYVLTFLTIVVIMNAFNLIDGVDGLAASMSIITTSTFAWFFYVNKDYDFAFLGFTFSASLLAFLIFNFAPARIFMGDTGSMLCGIVNAIMVIHFVETANAATIFKVSSSPALGFGVLIMPLLDTLRVFAVRIFNGKSPFFPDRNHLHHILLDRGLTHKVVTILLCLVAICFIAITYIALPLGTTAVIGLQVAIYFSAVLFLQMTGKKNKLKKNDASNDEKITFSQKVKYVVTLISAKETPSSTTKD